MAAAALAMACGSTTTESVTGPSAVRCQISLPAQTPPVPPAGAAVSLAVSTSRDCTWTAASDASWLTLTPASGQGSTTIALTVSENARPSSRSAVVEVNDARATIVQDAAPCRFELASPSARVRHEGGRTSVRVTTLNECEWQAGGSTDWARVLTSSGAGSGTVDIDVEPNPGAGRSTTVTIGGEPFVIIQDARPRPNDPAPPPSPGDPPPIACSFALDSESASFASAAAQGAVRVLTELGCAWAASSSASWISPGRAGGSGPDVLTYQVAANTSTVSDRSGSLTVAGRTHRVTQQACPLSIEGGVPNFPPRGGDGEFRVTTDPGCTWTVSSNADWIRLSRSNGAGSGVVGYRIEPNPVERDRSGTVTVSGRTKTIVQQALGQS